MRTIHKTVKLTLPADQERVQVKVLESIKVCKLKEVRAYSGPSSSTIAGFPVADYPHVVRVKLNNLTAVEFQSDSEAPAYRKVYLREIPFSGELIVELTAPVRDQEIEAYITLLIEE